MCGSESEVMEIRACKPEVDAHQDNFHVCCGYISRSYNFCIVRRVDENLGVSSRLYVRNAMRVQQR